MVEPTAEVAEPVLAVEPAPVQASLEETQVKTPVEPTINYEEKFNELQEKFDKLSDEFSVLTNNFNHLKVERDALKEFKDATEATEKKQVIDKYSTVLPEDVIKQFTEKLDSYSAIELDKELCFEAHKNDTLEPQTANFSYKNNDSVEESELRSYLNAYKIN